MVPDVTPGRTLTQHNPVSNGGVFSWKPKQAQGRVIGLATPNRTPTTRKIDEKINHLRDAESSLTAVL